MTDHATNKTANSQSPHKPANPESQPNSALNTAPKAKELTAQKAPSSLPSSSALKQTTAKPAMKMVDIVIAGTVYNIYCPINEEDELQDAADSINKFVLNLKKDAPNLSQENLLLLCCLNLYEKNNEKTPNDSATSKQTDALLRKIIDDAHSILA